MRPDENSNHRRGYRRMENRRQQICEVAARLFALHGYENTKLEMIAEELGYSRANLYHYVKNKEEVLALLSEDFLQALLEEAQKVTSGEVPIEERVEKLFHTHVTFAVTHPEGVILRGFDPRNKVEQWFEKFPAIVKHADQYVQFVRAIIQQGIDDGTFKVTDVKIATVTLLGALNAIPQWYRPGGKLTLDQIISKTTEILLGGLINPLK